MRHWAGSSPHRKNMKEPTLVLCGQHSFGEPKDGACMDENPRSGRYCRFARPRFAAETPVTTNAQAEPPRGFVHAPCPEQSTQSSVLSALFKKRARKNSPDPAGKIHTMLRFVDAPFAFVSVILHGQRTHNKITPQVDLSLVFRVWKSVWSTVVGRDAGGVRAAASRPQRSWRLRS